MAPPSHAPPTIEPVGPYFKVKYPHKDRTFELGLFATVEEGRRVSDVLMIKEAVDSNEDPTQLDLNFALQRYNVDSDTVGEILSVSFGQVVQDLQVCAVQPLPGGKEDLASNEMPSAASLPAAGSSAPPRLPLGLKALPPRAPVGRSRSNAAAHPDSAAATAFKAAGLANARSAAARQAELDRSGAGPCSAPDLDNMSKAAAEDRKAPRYPHPLSPPITARKRPLGRPESDEMNEGGSEHSVAGTTQSSGRLQPIRAAVKGVTPHGGRWRPQLYLRVERDSVNQAGTTTNFYVGTTATRQEAALVSDILNIWRHSCYRTDPALGDYNYDYAETSKLNDIMEKVMACGTSCKLMRTCVEELVASGRLAALVGVMPPQDTAEAVPSPGVVKSPIQGRLAGISGLPSGRPAGAADRLPPGNIKGVHFDPRINRWRPRILLNADADGKPTLTGKKKQNISLPTCADQLHGAALHDIGSMWFLLKTNQDLASGHYNLDRSIYSSRQDLLETIRACQTITDFREAAAQLKDSGVVKDIVNSMPARALPMEAQQPLENPQPSKRARITRTTSTKAAAPSAAVAENIKEARDEIRIRALEDMYNELKGFLQDTPGISEVEVVGFLARFVQLRDSRRWQFSQITNWNSHKQYDLIREYVRQTLGVATV